MQNQENNKVFYGGFFVRLAAAWVDAFIVGCALITLRLPSTFMAGSENLLYRPILFQFSLWDIFLYLLGTAYYVFFTYATGATIGKRMFSLQVVAADGGKLSLWDALYRETIGKYLSGAFLSLGYVMAGIDKEKRAFHDMMADTRVVYSFGKQPRRFAESASPVSPAEAAGRYRDVEQYYTRSTEKYPAADYGYQKEEKPEDAQEPEKVEDMPNDVSMDETQENDK